VTASHNKFSDNGIKVFAAGGRKLSDADEKRIEAELHFLLSHESDAPAADGEVGVVIRRSDAVSLYVEHLVGLFGEGSLAGLRIVIDAANGAMSNVASLVLRRLGADVIVMNDAPNGTNINDACGATFPQALCEFISGTGTGVSVDLGFSYDGDGDPLKGFSFTCGYNEGLGQTFCGPRNTYITERAGPSCLDHPQGTSHSHLVRPP
jgi:phosphoglucosamine mutase